MSEKIVLKAVKREAIGGGGPKRLRKAGKIPAVVYSAGKESVSVVVEEIDTRGVIHHHGVITLDVEGEAKEVIIKDVQFQCLTSTLFHIDFQEVDATHKVTSVIPVEPVGTPAGASKGGQLEQNIHELEVIALASDLPEVLNIDVSGMGVDAVMLVKDLVLPEGVEAHQNGDAAVFSVHAPGSSAEATEEDAAE